MLHVSERRHERDSVPPVGQLTGDPQVRLLAIDLRGTMARTPDVTDLSPEFAAAGVSENSVRRALRRLEEARTGELKHRGDVLDWSAFAAHFIARETESHHRIRIDAILRAFGA